MNRRHYQHLSNALSDALNKVGASEHVRRLRQSNAITNDILTTLCKKVKGEQCSTYTFGSFAEGTTTPGLHSDIDTLICVEYPPVVEHADENEEVESLLLIQDDITPAGYAKLQWIEHGIVLYDRSREFSSLDLFGRPVLPNDTYFDDMTHDLRSGPAGTTSATTGFPDLDYVPAFLCKSWPKQAHPWLGKTRATGFPSCDVVDKFKSYGCFLVPVGQPFSSEKGLQWRLSFSIQERKLMLGLNETQYKCYVCLKMIKNDWIKALIKKKSLTSYHCKTCLLYSLEVIEEKAWRTENLILLVLKCINTLKMWISEGFIPNYFIPDENMWKADSQTQLAVIGVLEQLLQTGSEFVFNIRSDSVGRIVTQSVCDESNYRIVLESNTELKTSVTKERLMITKVSDSANNEEQNKDQTKESACLVDDIAETTSHVGVKDIESNTLDAYEDVNNDAAVDNIVDANLSGQDLDEKLLDTMPAGSKDTLLRLHEMLTDSERDSSNRSGETITMPQDEQEQEEKTDSRIMDLTMYKIHFRCIDSVLGNGRELLELFRENYDIDESIQEHQRLLSWLNKQTRVSRVYTEPEMKKAISFIQPLIYTSLGSHLAVKYMQSLENEKYFDMSMENMFQGHVADSQSGKIKQAAVLFSLGRYNESMDMLREIDEIYDAHVTTWGRCLKGTDIVNEVLCNKIRNENLSTEEVLHNSVSGCVSYLPAEADIIPRDLKYEMFRSVFSETPRIPEKEDFFECVHVDSTFYLYYLQYRIYEKLGLESEKKHALAKMLLVLEEDLNLGHPDTANNLIGCILIEMEETRAAWQCFCDSWKIRPDHNAAKWHMAILLAEIVAIFNEIDDCISLESLSDIEPVSEDEPDVTVLYRRN